MLKITSGAIGKKWSASLFSFSSSELQNAATGSTWVTSTSKSSSWMASFPLVMDLSSSSKSNSLSRSSYSTFSSNSLKSGANADQFSTWFWAHTLTTPGIISFSLDRV